MREHETLDDALIGVAYRHPSAAEHAFSVCDVLPGAVVLEWRGGRREKIWNSGFERLLETYVRF